MDNQVQHVVLPEGYYSLQISGTSPFEEEPASNSSTASEASPRFEHVYTQNSLLSSSSLDATIDAGITALCEDEQGQSPISATPPKRGRGRPPKYPKLVRALDTKPLKKRSKDGCITCRRRKKKCDETKPTCLICHRSNNVCEGYGSAPSKWASTNSELNSVSTREASAALARDDLSSSDMDVTWELEAEEAVNDLPRDIAGVETETDWLLLEHYPKLSCILNFPDSLTTTFTKVLLGMALGNQGLMHSILYLSGSHLTNSPGRRIQTNRHLYHLDCALKDLNFHQKIASHDCEIDDPTVDDCTVAQLLVIFLSSVIGGQCNGEYLHHMDAARHLLNCRGCQNEQFQKLSTSLLAYYDFTRNLTRPGRIADLSSWTPFRIPSFVQREAGTFFGVFSMLFTFMSRTTIIRDHIRDRRNGNLKPYVDKPTRALAHEIETWIENWIPPATKDASCHRLSELYRQCNYVYLYRTILDSVESAEINDAVNKGLKYLREVGSSASAQSVLLTPIFILGCAAFQVEQRREIEGAIERLKKYRGGGNIAPAKVVMDNVWWMLDGHMEAQSWDWDHAMERLGMDFIVA